MSEREVQPEVNIGVVGHVDHGKTTLVQALTGVWTARHSEELKRGMTIKLGYADGDIYKCTNCPEPDAYSPEPKCPRCPKDSEPVLQRRVSYVDAPGHEILMATMLSGSSLMDGALLVIAANEPCPQPQTREHFMALDIVGVRKLVVVQNKIDVVSKDQALKNYQQIKKFLEGTWAEDAVIIPVSALHKANIDALLEAIQEEIPTPPRDLDSPPLMWIARSFDVNKPGTPPEKLVGGVVGGSLIRGILRVGDKIEIRPGYAVRSGSKVEYVPLESEVVSLRFGKIEVEEAKPGGLVAVGTRLDPSVTKADALVGSVLGIPGSLPPVYNEITMEYHLLERVVGFRGEMKMTPLRKGEVLMLTVGTNITIGVITDLTKDEVTVRLQRPVAAWPGARAAFNRRIQGRWRLAGWGIIKGGNELYK